jgi:hypothetical protein
MEYLDCGFGYGMIKTASIRMCQYNEYFHVRIVFTNNVTVNELYKLQS